LKGKKETQLASLIQTRISSAWNWLWDLAQPPTVQHTT